MGYDKSPDYGGPPVGRWTGLLWAVAVLTVAIVFGLYV
jgi:hypothetical protein